LAASMAVGFDSCILCRTMERQRMQLSKPTAIDDANAAVAN